MAYSKQTWTDDVTAITADRMTHIEQGIYDNSIATDKIKPSGTATTTAGMEEGQITDVIGFKSLKLKGQTSQVSYDGYNILNGIIENKTTNGVTITKNEDNSYKVSGTATAVALFSTNINTTLEASKTYVIGFGNSNSNVQLSIRPSDGSTQYANTTTQKYVTYTPNENIDIRLFVRVANGATVNETIYPIIYVGNTEKSYEPYVGGKASPNPDFPQEVNNVSGDNVIAINGSKNLFDKDINIVTPGYLNGNGAVVTSDATLSYQDRFIKVQPSTVYTISSGTNTIYRIAEYTADKTFITRVLNANASNSYSFATSSQTHFIKMAGTLTTVLNTLQIEKGNTATSYVAHQGNNFEINLGKNLIEDTFKGYNINAQGKFETGGTSVDFDVQIARVMQGVTYTITPSTNVIAYFNGKPTTSSTSYNGSREVITNTNTLTPTKSGYIAIRTATTDTAQLEKGAIATSYAPYFPPIELCKTGTFQDYIYKANGKWYKHKEIEKLTYTGAENWSTRSAGARQLYELNVTGVYSTASTTLGYSNQYKAEINLTDDNTIRIVSGNTLGIHNDTIGSLANFKTFLSNNNLIYYYPLATPIDEEITYAPLLRQLDELYNSGLYDVTNISQDNSSEAFILDIEACKNNINGIVEYIRR